MTNTAGERLSFEQALEKYRSTDINEIVDLNQFHEISLAKMQNLDSKVDIPMNWYTEQNFRKEHLFREISHPLPELYSWMGNQISEYMGLGPIPEKVIRNFESQQYSKNLLAVPIHPQVLDHFNIEWGDEDTTYSYFNIADLTFQEHLERYLKYI